MKRLFLGGLLALGLCANAFAQTTPAPNYLNPIGKLSPALGVVLIDPTTKDPYSATGGGGGGGAVTIANGADVTQGNTGDAACGTDNGTCSIAALIKRTNQRITTLNTTLGSPFQAGGSVGISGTLPAFGSTPTFNLGTLNGAATAANQSTANTSLSNIDGDLGSSSSTACASGASTCDIIAVLKGILSAAQDTTAVGVKITPSATSTDGIAASTSTSAEACRVLKASAGNVYSVSGYANDVGYAMLFNATSAPADGAVTPVIPAIYVPAKGSWSADFGSIPLYLSTGITVCYSSTGPFTKTAVSTNNVLSGRVQ